ncbi:hypothetical protein POM88_021790 [Heracleum sosnowskyi]|uniref:MULE transposase domain-containing protein n=1 Tax=Heracleum sosnowskyi TaxID=360622 RepID=A0AAD8IHK1_9APIA|nr:hypothetical protein POM88_021790 [Heracleum sosnowskyi]
MDNVNESEYNCFVAANGSKYWTPNCDDKYKPQTNTYIPTLEEAFTFDVDYGRIFGFDVRKSTKKSDARGNLLAKYMLCNRGGNPKKKKSEETCVNVGPRGFVLMSFVEEHNHPLTSGAERMFLRCNRNMFIPYRNFIMDHARANIGPTKAHSLAKEQFGSFEDVGATVSDFKNFSRDIKVHAIGQANFDVFGDIVSFDPTFRTNIYNMLFVPFTGVDNHWKNVTFAVGLLAKENYKNFKWLINSFKKAIGRAPFCVITDQCPAIKKALNK